MSYTFIYVYGANLTGLGNLIRQMMKQLIPHCIMTKSGLVANSLRVYGKSFELRKKFYLCK